MNRRDLLGALRLLTERGWALGLLGMMILSVAFVQLGGWQHHRYAAKVLRNTWIEANYGAEPVPLAVVLPTPSAPLPQDQQWRPVTIEGVYETSGQLVVRNRSFGRESGFEVLVPLRRDDHSLVLIHRGWVPMGQTGVAPAAVPLPPPGRVEVTARLRPSEPPADRTPPPGQVQRINLAQIGAGLDGPLYQAYGDLAGESPAPTQAPRRLLRPDEDLGPHLGYAWQWWLFAAAGYGVLGYHMLREARRRNGNTEPIRWRLPSPVGRSRSGELSDEEWEDAANG